MRRQGPGIIKQKLARLLEEAFRSSHFGEIMCDPESLYDAKGAYRTDPKMGCSHPWWGVVETKGHLGITIYGAYTMTECVKHGILLVEDTPTSFQLYIDRGVTVFDDQGRRLLYKDGPVVSYQAKLPRKKKTP